MADASEKTLEEVSTTAASIAEATFVPRVSAERPCCEEDFRDYKRVAEKRFQYLASQNETGGLGSLVVLCAEHASLQPWSTTLTVDTSRQLLDALCRAHACSTVGQLLAGGKGTKDLFGTILLSLRPKLLKESWKCYPSTVAAFKWLLLQVKFPHLNFERHSVVFTTSLIILDDFVTENKKIGIQCLHHYITNVTATDFRCQGRDVVVYDALSSLMYTREPEVLDCLLPCILTTLKKLKTEASASNEDLSPYVSQWGKFDDVLNNIFSAMMADEHVNVRMMFLKYLPQFILSRGLPIVVFTTQMLAVLSSYLEARGEGIVYLIKTTLEVCLVFLRTVRVRLAPRALDILQLLLRKLHDFTSGDHSLGKQDSQAFVQLVGEIVQLLIQSAPEQLREFSMDYIHSLGERFSNFCIPRTPSKI